MKRILIVSASLIVAGATAQTNIVCTDPAAEQVMLGNYDPLIYQASSVISAPATVAAGIHAEISPDSLHAYLVDLAAFKTRNSGSDTVSASQGIGAARAWIYKKFQQFSAQNESRLLPFYLRFDLNICGIMRHKNVCAVLPGTDTSYKDIIIVEGHFDSRCNGLCDTACLAEGMEDNGSGTALVMELARVMSKYSFRRTIVFMATTAEEQGLLGAEAFALYAGQKGVKIRAVLNNDVIGGVICGNTSSPPGCPGAGHIDSTHVRLFSAGGFNSPHKQLSRYIKLEYKEMVVPAAMVPMTLHVMTPEDRGGRGGDHIPFRQKGYTAMRFTSANEHGDANVGMVGYIDRQHTSGDVLGVDTDSDMQIDSFFVDFNYLARNAVINGNAAAMAAMGPRTPDFVAYSTGNDMVVTITKELQYPGYRLALRTVTNDWDTVFAAMPGPTFSVTMPDNNYILSVASVDAGAVESLFSGEQQVLVTSLKDSPTAPDIELLQNQPNPFDEATTIAVKVNRAVSAQAASIVISDLLGRKVAELPVSLAAGINEVEFAHGYHASGTYLYSLVIDGRSVLSGRMVFRE